VTLLTFLDEHGTAITAVFAVCAGVQAVISHFRGKRIEEAFREATSPVQKFRESGASGRRTRPFSLGGASRVLVVVVTDREVLIEGIWPIFTYLGSKYGLTCRVPLTNIKRAAANGEVVKFSFTDDSGNDREIQLHLKNANRFLSAALSGA
jgi:hypothetical protein